MILSDQDRGRTVDVDVGSVITVRLRENPTSGYRWSVEAIDGLEQLADRYDQPAGGIGAESVREFEFRVPLSGVYGLRLKNWREWEGENSVIDRFDAKIIAK